MLVLLPSGSVIVYVSAAVFSRWAVMVLDAPVVSYTRNGMSYVAPIRASLERLPVMVTFLVSEGARLLPSGSLRLVGTPAVLTTPSTPAQPCTAKPFGVVS